MKKGLKKSLIVGLSTLTILPLVAFSNSNKVQFGSALKSVAQQNDQKVSVGITKFETYAASAPTKATKEERKEFNELGKSLKSVKITGETHKNAKKDMYVLAKIQLGKTKLPIKTLQNKSGSKSYISADIYKDLATFAKTLGLDLKEDQNFVKKAKGKYIDVNAVNNNSSGMSLASISKAKTADKLQQVVQTQVGQYISSLPNKNFTKKKNEISTTLTNKELAAVLKKVQKKVKSDKALKEYKSFLTNDVIKEIQTTSMKIKVKITVNTKTKASKTEYTIHLPRTKKENGFLITATVKTEKAKKLNFSLPKKSEILPKKEVEKAFNNLFE